LRVRQAVVAAAGAPVSALAAASVAAAASASASAKVNAHCMLVVPLRAGARKAGKRVGRRPALDLEAEEDLVRCEVVSSFRLSQTLASLEFARINRLRCVDPKPKKLIAPLSHVRCSPIDSGKAPRSSRGEERTQA
jgi:hypothetical protein